MLRANRQPPSNARTGNLEQSRGLAKRVANVKNSDVKRIVTYLFSDVVGFSEVQLRELASNVRRHLQQLPFKQSKMTVWDWLTQWTVPLILTKRRKNYLTKQKQIDLFTTNIDFDFLGKMINDERKEAVEAMEDQSRMELINKEDPLKIDIFDAKIDMFIYSIDSLCRYVIAVLAKGSLEELQNLDNELTKTASANDSPDWSDDVDSQTPENLAQLVNYLEYLGNSIFDLVQETTKASEHVAWSTVNKLIKQVHHANCAGKLFPQYQPGTCAEYFRRFYPHVTEESFTDRVIELHELKSRNSEDTKDSADGKLLKDRSTFVNPEPLLTLLLRHPHTPVF